MKYVKKYYVWRIISDDGLIKNPEPFGPYYDKDWINGYNENGFNSEQEAVETLKEFDEKYPWEIRGDWTLVTLYRICDNDWE